MLAILAVGFVAQLVTSLAYVTGVFGASRALGVPVQRVQLGMGPTPFRGKVGEVTLALGFPLGSYVQFQRDEPPKGAPEDAELPPDAFEKASRSKRVAIALAGPLAMALVPMIGLGPVEGALCVARGIPQLVMGAISPFGTAQELIGAAAALPALTLGPVLAAKMTAFNLLPVPGTGMWTLLRGLVGFGWNRGCIGAPIPAVGALSWLVALVAWGLT